MGAPRLLFKLDNRDTAPGRTRGAVGSALGLRPGALLYAGRHLRQEIPAMMKVLCPLRSAVLLGTLLVTACGGADTAKDPLAERDPAVSEALSDPLMADPDLTTQNQDGAALTGGGPASAAIPPEQRSPEEIAAARRAALAAAGGAIAAAPAPEKTTDTSRFAKAATAQAIAAALGLGGKGCADSLDYSALWAARLPPPFEVYPRGHVGQAAGAQTPGCALRVVGFVTPVPSSDVLDYYAARAAAQGFSVRHVREGDDQTLDGAKGAARYGVIVRRRADGLTQADIVTSGF